MVIINYYTNLSREERKVFRDEVIARCGIQYPTFYKKLKEDSWRKAEAEVIAAIAARLDSERRAGRP